MLLAKDRGGCTITYQGTVYAWPEDGSACEVPEPLGLDLLAVAGGGFAVADPPKRKRGTPKAASSDGGDGADGAAGEDPAAGT